MRSIHIKASREYDVLVERGLLDRAGELLREVSAPGMAAIVSDDTVYALYGERTVKALEKAGYRVHSFTFPAGEGSKNLSTYADVLHFLGEHRFSRSDVVVALGGGVGADRSCPPDSCPWAGRRRSCRRRTNRPRPAASSGSGQSPCRADTSPRQSPRVDG